VDTESAYWESDLGDTDGTEPDFGRWLTEVRRAGLDATTDARGFR